MKNLVFTLAVLSMCTFFSCGNDDDDEGTANNNTTPTFTPPTENAFQEMRNGFLASITKDTVFDASTGISFTSVKGVNVYIYGGCLVDENWTTVTGNVNLSYTELFDIGSMAIANKPLLGRDASGNVAPLVTGGEFNIRASQNGKALQGCNLNLNVPIGLTDAQLPENAYMSAWIIDEDSADFVWEEGKQREAFIEGGATGEGATNYYCWFPFGWTNIDWLYSLPGEKTPIYVKVPDGFTNKNCAVFAAYLDMPATLALMCRQAKMLRTVRHILRNIRALVLSVSRCALFSFLITKRRAKFCMRLRR